MILMDVIAYIIFFALMISLIGIVLGYIKFVINGIYNNLVHFRLEHEKENYIWYD